jgi:hypothetical protein
VRILIVGTVPPPGGDAAFALAELATAHLAEGHDVEMLSPDNRSAAHRSARLEGPVFALRLAWLSRRFESIVIHFEEGLPVRAHAARLWRVVTLALVAAALKMYQESTVRFDGGSAIPGGIGSRAMGEVWSVASHVVLSSREDRDELVSTWGLPEERVVVVSPRSAVRAPVPSGWVVGDATDPRTEVLELVRVRAAADREARAARVALGGAIGAPPGSPFTGERGQAVDAAAFTRALVVLARKLVARISATNPS